MNVLLVDDQQAVLDGLTHGIRWDEIGVTRYFTATSAADARRVLQSEPIDVMLCDIEMPRESGLQLLEWIREREQSPVFVILTAYASFDYAQTAVALHAFDYVLLPSPYPEIQETLVRAMNFRREQLAAEGAGDGAAGDGRSGAASLARRASPAGAEVGNGIDAWQQIVGQRLGFMVLNHLRESAKEIEAGAGERTQVAALFEDFQRVLYHLPMMQSPLTRRALREAVPALERVSERTPEQASGDDAAATMDSALRFLNDLPDARKSHGAVEQAIEYITQNLGERLTRADVSDAVFVSPAHLSRKFKEETGMFLSDFIRGEKIKMACQLLAETSLPISEIALSIGFQNFSYFSKLFRQTTGESPKAYRRSRRQYNT